ncbi:protein SUPPRESSOR OF GENE SILENCING 3 homolog [Cornus florida]|uniref:protein SUPPRESSOR OF GENE SILENCING 3 homolog n=1 Tax=Cornus florida TaxID=4283 RepID=UPI0028A1CED5|nr:protein SUPPRESSOR OF GENE SILENCING 3 homolog [Cornus florida]
MNSRKGGAKPFVAGTTDSSKENSISEISNVSVDRLNHGVADISLDLAQAGVQKLGIQSNSGSGKGSGSSLPIVNADSKRLPGRGYSRPQSSNRGIESNYTSPIPVISPALQHGWNWKSAASTLPSERDLEKNEINPNSHTFGVSENKVNKIGDDDDDSDAVDDTDDELFGDDWDSDVSQKSHDTRKRSRWFNAFFDILDKLTVEQIHELARQWHCPACQNGPGAIDWYRGLQPLTTHAKTKGSNRVKLHREFAEVLEEELHRRGTSVIPAGEAYGKWKGLDKTVKDHEIVWPPMVVIMNTRLEKDDSDKWLGMGNQELLDYFSSYRAVKARRSYGPQGHQGMSVLIFEGSAMGYLEAERLDKHFKDKGTDRETCDPRRVPFYP